MLSLQTSQSNSTAENSSSTNVIRLHPTPEMMGQLSGMQRAGGYENLAQVIESALALKNLIDAAHREGYTVLVMQTPRGKQRRMQYHP